MKTLTSPYHSLSLLHKKRNIISYIDNFHYEIFLGNSYIFLLKK